MNTPSLDAFIKVPSWAYDFCYYHFFLALIIVVSSLWSLVSLFFLPASVKKQTPYVWISVALTIILSGIVTVVLTMMQFWVCRSALAPGRVQRDTKELFATMCKENKDCQAVSSDTDAGCTCGGRGVCGGCMYTKTQGSGDYEGVGAF